MPTKPCTSCNIEKYINLFSKKSSSKDGHMSTCKECESKKHKEYNKKHKERNLDRANKWTQENQDKVKENKRRHYLLNKEKCIERARIQYENNREKIIKRSKERYDSLDKEILNKKRRVYKQTRYKESIQYRLSEVLRHRLNMAVRNQVKKGSAVRDLGCSIDFLRQYLESKFLPGMSWENYGFRGWHIDHIKPLASFDLTNREDLLQACHYTNLQPLWAKENMSKGAKLL